MGFHATRLIAGLIALVKLHNVLDDFPNMPKKSGISIGDAEGFVAV